MRAAAHGDMIRRGQGAASLLGLLLWLGCGDGHPATPARRPGPSAPLVRVGRGSGGPRATGAVTSAAPEAGTAVDAAEQDPSGVLCLPRRRAIDSWRSSVVLPWASDSQGSIFTSSVRLQGEGTHSELLVSEAALHQISMLRGCAPSCTATAISAGLVAPVRAQAVDFDADGDRDLLIADIGLVQARPDPVGRVVLLNNQGSDLFEPRVLLDQLGRVACAEAADLDADGDLDVVVCEFGAADGSLFWLERVPGGTLLRHELRAEAGAIHAFPFDADGDGDLDLAVALSQRAQQVLLFRNRGGGAFDEETAFQAASEGFGLTGIEPTDLDRDGDIDLLVTGGDYLDESFDFDAQGVWWLENDGGGSFSAHLAVEAVGAYGVRAADVDGDCDLDLVLAQLLIEDSVPLAAQPSGGLSWLENDGAQGFGRRHAIAGPPHAVALEVVGSGDTLSVFTGSMTLAGGGPEHQRLVRLTPVFRDSK